MSTATVTRPEAIEQTRARLVAKAIAEGVQIVWNTREQSWFAKGAKHADGTRNRYAVTPESCECLGFAKFGYCKHHSLLLDRLALRATDDDPSPTPAAPQLAIVPRPEETPATAALDGDHADDYADGDELTPAAELDDLAGIFRDFRDKLHPRDEEGRELLVELEAMSRQFRRAALSGGADDRAARRVWVMHACLQRLMDVYDLEAAAA